MEESKKLLEAQVMRMEEEKEELNKDLEEIKAQSNETTLNK